jgi:hypothetical protein
MMMRADHHDQPLESGRACLAGAEQRWIHPHQGHLPTQELVHCRGDPTASEGVDDRQRQPREHVVHGLHHSCTPPANIFARHSHSHSDRVGQLVSEG